MDARDTKALWDAAARAYEAAHGNPMPQPASGMRWRITPRVAVTAVVVLACVVAVAVWVQRPATVTVPAVADVTAAGATPVPVGEVTVHVAGAVAQPGVVTLAAGSRVADAVAAAGGATPDALTDAINLARTLVDGEQVYVPAVGEASAPGASGLINVNTADAAELERLPGVGAVLAQRIVSDREAQGPFATVEDLQRVKGIGPAVLDGLREAAVV